MVCAKLQIIVPVISDGKEHFVIFAYPCPVVKMEIVLRLWSAIVMMDGLEDFVKFVSLKYVYFQKIENSENYFFDFIANCTNCQNGACEGPEECV